MPKETKPIQGEKPASGIGMKQAVLIAAKHFEELYPQLADANVMLEEVEESEDNGHWLITMGFDKLVPPPTRPALAARMFGPQAPEFARHYKIIKIESKTGRVVSMKIRSLK